MTEVTASLIREQATTSAAAALAQRLPPLLDQPIAVQVHELVTLCQQMSQQYQQAPDSCLERSWWRLFNQAGIRLYETLDRARAVGYQGLNDEEAERAYFLLIHVAYFFTSGGVAEALWPLLPAETGVNKEAI